MASKQGPRFTGRAGAVAVAIALACGPSVATAQCPAPSTPTFYAYQSAATAVELVIANTTIAGADHWEVTRTKSGGPTTTLLPASVPPGTSSIIDDGQGLQFGATYSYNLIVQNTAGQRTSYPASVVDVGRTPPLPLGSSLTLSDQFGVDPNTGQRINWWLQHFPSPIGRTYAKYLGTARVPATNAVLPCASVTVRYAGTGTLATLHADRWGKFGHPNPITADRRGRFEFYADNGSYDIAVSGGSSSYTLAGVTVFDPRTPQTAHAAGGAAALTLTAGEPASARDGNVYLKLTRPHSTDGNDPPNPYRLLANHGENAWALTYNLALDEQTNAPTLDDPIGPAFFLRVHRPNAALEFGLDPAYGAVDDGPWLAREPDLETLLHAGPDRVHLKSFLGPVGVAVKAAQAGLRPGDVVSYRRNGTVRRAKRARMLHPFVIQGVDEPGGVSKKNSRVYLAVAGRTNVRVRGPVAVNDPLISTADGIAVAAPGETDVRYIVGFARRLVPAGYTVPIAANMW